MMSGLVDVLTRLEAAKAIDHNRSAKTIGVLFTVKMYLEEAREQMARLQRAKSTGQYGFDSASVAVRSLHFYLICWRMIGKMIWALEKEFKFSAPKEVRGRDGGQLHLHSNARHDFEHFDERLRGKADSKGTRLAQPNILAVLVDDDLHMGGKIYRGVQTSLPKLEAIVRDLIQTMTAEAQQMLRDTATLSSDEA